MSTKTKREVHENQRFEEVYYDTGENGYCRTRRSVHNNCRVELVDNRWGGKSGILKEEDGTVIGSFTVPPEKAARAARGLPVRWYGTIARWSAWPPEVIIDWAGDSQSWVRERVRRYIWADPFHFTREDTCYVLGAYAKFPQVLDDGESARGLGERALAAYHDGMSLDEFATQEARTTPGIEAAV